MVKYAMLNNNAWRVEMEMEMMQPIFQKGHAPNRTPLAVMMVCLNLMKASLAVLVIIACIPVRRIHNA